MNENFAVLNNFLWFKAINVFKWEISIDKSLIFENCEVVSYNDLSCIKVFLLCLRIFTEI
jgi:hypothetical protein